MPTIYRGRRSDTMRARGDTVTREKPKRAFLGS
jgi:hypothetical protein